jgi:hypothetical protein
MLKPFVKISDAKKLFTYQQIFQKQYATVVSNSYLGNALLLVL